MARRTSASCFHWALRIATCLALGVATTSALAWGVAYVGERPTRNISQGKELTEDSVWVWSLRESFGWSSTVWFRLSRAGIPRGPSIVIPDVHDAPTTQRPPGDMQRGDLWMSNEFGWPLRAIGYALRDTQPQTGWKPTDAVLVHRLDRRDARHLPLRPLWRGFGVDVAIHAALWSPLLLLPAVRRSVRHHRGRCPRCGYDLRGDFAGGCPECGWNRGASATGVR